MKKIIVCFCSILLMGCAHLHIYQPSIEQGNVITDKMVTQIHKGMTQNQVEKIMGTPILTNTFNDDRINYIYTFKPNTGKQVKKCLTLTFAKGKLIKIEKDW